MIIFTFTIKTVKIIRKSDKSSQVLLSLARGEFVEQSGRAAVRLCGPLVSRMLRVSGELNPRD